MKSLFVIFIGMLCSFGIFAQATHTLEFESTTGKIIQISFKARFATIHVNSEEKVEEAFLELKEFMKHISSNHFWSRIYPLYVITPDNKYFTYPLNRQKLNRWKTKS